MRRRCLCECHDTDEETHEIEGVNALDPIEAVTACPACLNGHTDVFATPKFPRVVRRSSAEIAAAWAERELELRRKRQEEGL